MKTILVDAVDCFVSKDGVIFDEMHELLDTYPNVKILLTGATDEQFRKFGLDKMPYEVFTLKHNPEKANPNYYQKMLEHFSFKSDEVIYFEHNQEAVDSAKSVGIVTHFFDYDKKDLNTLRVFLDNNLK